MKQPVSRFQYSPMDYLRLFGAIARYSWEIESAYFAQRWAVVISTLVYNMSFVLFFNVIFANTREVAGYSHDAMLFLLFIQNFVFFLSFAWSMENLKDLSISVNRGELDLVLSKPLPHLFYVTIRRLNFSGTLSNLCVNIYLAFLINWHSLGITLPHLLVGVAIFCLGQLALHASQFFFTLPVFWTGNGEEFFYINYEMIEPKTPWEGFGPKIKWVLLTAVPAFIATALTTSVILGKSEPLPLLLISLLITSVLLTLKRIGWNAGLRNYTSASS